MQQPSPALLIAYSFVCNFPYSVIAIQLYWTIQEETICSEDGSESYLYFQRGYS